MDRPNERAVYPNSALMTATSRRRWSINTQLLLAVNVPLACILAVLLTLDYRREMANAVAEKHAGLNEEAMMIYHGIYYLAQNDRPETLQRFIDSVCGHMRETQSLGHHIAVRWQGGLIQAEPNRGDSSELFRTIEQAAGSSDHVAAMDDETLVVGRFSGRGVDVFVSEFTTTIRQSVRRNILFHLISLVILAITAAAIVNPLLWRTVARPVKQLSHAVARIAAGRYEVSPAAYPTRELNELSTAIRSMTASLAANENDRRSQMARARRIQENLMPNASKVPGLSVAHLFAPADEVAGDYYDFLRLPDQSWLVCIADVTGHGIPAALGSVILKTVLHSAVEHETDPGRILGYVNQRLIVLLPDQFISLWIGRWNPATCEVSYSSAGHEPALLVRADGELQPLNATGPLLGISDAATWERETVEMRYGDRLLLTTDGVAEAVDQESRQFGRVRLAETVAGCSALSPDEVVRFIRDVVREHQVGDSPTDDLTILLLESRPSRIDA